MVRTNQGGSVLSFIVIGVILASLLVSGTYVVRRQAASPIPSQPTKTADNKPTTNQPQNDKQDKNNSDQELPPGDRKDSASRDNQLAPAAGTSNPGALPQTGPVETVGIFIALGFLSVTSVSYIRSRRPGLSL